MDHAISSNHFSVDIQAVDAMSWLEYHERAAYDAVVREFPEFPNHKMSGAWFDTDAMGVDVEWGSWLVDAIEATGMVWWEEGEPWAMHG